MKMKIKIDNKNREKLTKIIDAANGKAKTRLVSVDDLFYFADNCEKHLEKNSVPLSARSGCQYVWHEGVGCNSYGYSATATRVQIVRGTKDWFLVEADRSQTSTSRGCRSDWFIPTAQAVESVMASIERRLRDI
jgi:hypothetical protein